MLYSIMIERVAKCAGCLFEVISLTWKYVTSLTGVEPLLFILSKFGYQEGRNWHATRRLFV